MKEVPRLKRGDRRALILAKRLVYGKQPICSSARLPGFFRSASERAKSIAYSNPATGAASDTYIARLLERMGVADEMKEKTRFPPPGGLAANLLVSGEAELAIQQEPEIAAVAGVDRVGPPPRDLNSVSVFAVGLGVGTKEADEGQVLIKYLHSPQAIAVFKAHGLTAESGQ